MQPVIMGPCTVYLGDCLEILPTLSGIGAVISDPPFSARTHAGQDSTEGGGNDGMKRSSLGYSPWGNAQVLEVCRMPRSGWVCVITDHVLSRAWERGFRDAGRYVFAPLPIVVKGRSVRLTGDGPSSWTDWLMVSRTKAEIKWGTLPGSYEGSPRSIAHMGGKPLDAMQRICEDYSRRGDVVLDFCMGAATTGIACIRTGRKFIGIEKDPKHFQTACERIERELAQGILPLEPISKPHEEIPLAL